MIWETIRSRRLSVADLLDDLTPAEWDHPSLCAGWTVRDVAAHLTLQQMGVRDLPAMAARWRGTVNRTIQEAARHRAAAWTPDRMAAEIRSAAAARRHNLGGDRESGQSAECGRPGRAGRRDGALRRSGGVSQQGDDGERTGVRHDRDVQQELRRLHHRECHEQPQPSRSPHPGMVRQTPRTSHPAGTNQI